MKKIKTLTSALVLMTMGAALMLFTGCASIISGRQQAVTFTSSPDDAIVTIDGKQIGKTPLTAQLDRKGGAQIVTIEKPGYKTLTFQLKATVNGWFFGNLIFGGLLGSSTDSSTGAIHAYSQDMFNFTLNPLGATTLPASTEVKAFVITNYKTIIEELSTKPNQYLKALFSLMKVQPDQELDYSQKIKKLADENKDIVTFADKVAALAP